MALPAGRKGVLASELTPEGKIKNQSSLPEYAVSDAGKFLGVNSDGDLEFATPEAGGKIYLHVIHFGNESANYSELIYIYNSDPTPIDTGEKLLNYMRARNISKRQNMLPCIGKYNTSTQLRTVGVTARLSSDTDRRILLQKDDFASSDAKDVSPSEVLTDNVIEL